MAATSIFFNGRVISIPGSFSEVDASGLESVGLGASGIVAVLGTGEGGVPVSAVTSPKELQKFTRPEKMRATFRSGQLREVSGMLFEPAKDDAIRGGAAQVVALKVNPATKSAASLMKTGVPQIDLTSRDYGAFTEQVNVELLAGTSQGKKVTIRFEDIIEAGDNIGGSALATLTYAGGSTGFTTALVTINDAGDITVTGTRAGLGQSNLVDNSHPGGAATVVSSNAGDTARTVSVFGIVGGTPTKVDVALNGTTPVALGSFDAAGILGVYIDGAATLGTVTVAATTGPTSIFTVPPGTAAEGVIKCDYCHVAKTSVSVALDAGGVHNVLVFGRNAAGGSVASTVVTAGTTPVVTAANTFALLDFIVVGAVLVARTVTVTAVSVQSLASVQKTLQKAADLFNAKSTVIAGPLTRGFTFTITTGKTGFLTSDLDAVTAVNIKDPTVASLKADLYAVVAWINQNSVLVSAAVSTGATGVPDNTASPLFLDGGIEGTALFSHYQSALNLLKQLRVNSVVDLSGDPAVAAAVDAHCAYMGGIGRSERDGFVGLLNTAMDDVPTKSEAVAQIVNLNSRHIRAWPQAVERFNAAGEREEFLPPFGAAILAGMQAGSPVGTSLTKKTMNILGLRQHSSWNPVDDAEELIQAGVIFAEDTDGQGRRVVRNVTTHLSSSNIAFTEGSVNEAVNYAVYEFRTALEVAVGKRGFAGTVSATRSVAVGKLDALVGELVVTAYRSLDMELIVDVLDVSVELAPVIPINFVRTTVHLTTLAQMAAAQSA